MGQRTISKISPSTVVQDVSLAMAIVLLIIRHHLYRLLRRLYQGMERLVDQLLMPIVAMVCVAPGVITAVCGALENLGTWNSTDAM